MGSGGKFGRDLGREVKPYPNKVVRGERSNAHLYFRGRHTHVSEIQCQAEKQCRISHRIKLCVGGDPWGGEGGLHVCT